MTNWEYMWKVSDWRQVNGYERKAELTAFLKRAGSEGWELVGVAGSDYSVMWAFKRPKTG